MPAFFVSFVLIFFAELGDKSQLVALWFATRYRWWLVLAGVSVATLVVHLGSTALGESLGSLLPESLLLIVVALSFFVFAAWGLRGDRIDEPTQRVTESGIRALGVITTAFFLSELGDKTQLATITIAGDQDSFVGVWLGSTLGMVAADALAIAGGTMVGRRLSQRTTAVVAALLFGVFGALALVRATLLLLD
jgi:putative Ca2+/H+ antiporter (TMEM165/GDT1 family)